MHRYEPTSQCQYLDNIHLHTAIAQINPKCKRAPNKAVQSALLMGAQVSSQQDRSCHSSIVLSVKCVKVLDLCNVCNPDTLPMQTRQVSMCTNMHFVCLVIFRKDTLAHRGLKCEIQPNCLKESH